MGSKKSKKKKKRDEKVPTLESLKAAAEAAEFSFSPIYWDERNAIIKPWDVLPVTQYFLLKWTPILGPVYSLIILHLRAICFKQMNINESLPLISISYEEIADLCGISIRSVNSYLGERAFRRNWFLKLFINPIRQYVYDPVIKKKIRISNQYRVYLDEPLLPEDEEILRDRLKKEEIQKLIKEGVVDFRKYVEVLDKHKKSDDQKSKSSDKLACRSTIGFSDKNHQDKGEKAHLTANLATRSKNHITKNHLHANLAGRSNIRKLQRNLESPFPKPPNLGQIGDAEEEDNIYGTYNNTSSSTATPSFHKQKGNITDCRDLVEEIVHKFKGYISAYKVEELIEKCGKENVQNQLKWFDFRDNSWAKNGPVAAFIFYCESQTESPEAFLKAQRENYTQEQENAKKRQKRQYNGYVKESLKRLEAEFGKSEWLKVKDQLKKEIEGRYAFIKPDGSLIEHLVNAEIIKWLIKEGKLLSFEDWQKTQINNKK